MCTSVLVSAAMTIVAAKPTQSTVYLSPGAIKGPSTGAPNQLFVLGTPHLSQLPDTFRPEALKPLLNRLKSWQPEVIGIEALSGRQCDEMRRYPERYKNTTKTYCLDLSVANVAVGRNVPSATAKVTQILR